jgi:hypothetical protein
MPEMRNEHERERERGKSNEIKKTEYHGETESGWISRETQNPGKSARAGGYMEQKRQIKPMHLRPEVGLAVIHHSLIPGRLLRVSLYAM